MAEFVPPHHPSYQGAPTYGAPSYGHAMHAAPTYTQHPGAAPPSPQAPAETSQGIGAVQIFGAVCSVALVVGMLYWGISLVLRDVSEVPVIQALDTPMRVQPTDPGGQQMAHQGLAVNEIRAGGVATPAPDRIVLAPPPVALDAPTQTSSASRVTNETLPENEEVLALVDQLATRIAPLEPLDEAPVVASVPLSAVDAIPASVPGINRSFRPLPRPAERPATIRSASISTPVAPTPSGGPVRDVDPSQVPAGTRLVQLGAFDDPDAARREWDRLYGQFGDYMQGKGRMIMKARSGGRDFYRLRVVGFEGANDARRFCSAFLARNTACIPVVSR